MQRQPNYPKVAPTDQFYLWIALRLAKLWDESPWLHQFTDEVQRDTVLSVIGYYQDIVADAGLWRTFSDLHNQHYGTPLPHYGRSDDYIDYELNRNDVRFVMWWTLTSGDEQVLDPHDKELEALAEAFYQLLDEEYEAAPAAQQLLEMMDVDLNNQADAQRVYDLAYWLFWRSFLLKPSAQVAMNDVMPEAHAIIKDAGDEDATPQLQELNDRLMASTLAGPLPMKIGDWLRMLIAD